MSQPQPPAAEAVPPPPVPEPPPADWRRLDPRTVVVRPIRDLAGVAPALIAVVFLGGSGGRGVVSGLILGAIPVVLGVLRWFTTRYRIDDDQVELRTGLLVRKQLAVPRDRIRTVDATSDFMHRLFRLAELKIGTGHHVARRENSGGLTLRSVSHAEADRLRHLLLHRPAPAEPAAPAGQRNDPAPPATTRPGSTTLAELDVKWLRYAPFTLSGLVAVGALVGTGWRLGNELYSGPRGLRMIYSRLHSLAAAPLSTLIPIVVGSLIVVTTAASVLMYLYSYWHYRLIREPGGSLHVSRGLITTRAVSIDETRLRGVELVEPLLLRAVRGGRLTAVTTGLGRIGSSAQLLPPAPAARAHRVVGDVLRARPVPTRIPLLAHPAAALGRRMVRAVVGILLPAGVLAAANTIGLLPAWPWQAALALLPVAALLAVDRYRNLGHALTGGYLVTRRGSLERKTAVLQRNGVIGWRVHRSLLQRRAGLLTLGAIAAAGSGLYRVIDVAEAEGLAFADTATPGLLTPFLAGTTGPAGDDAAGQQPTNSRT